MKTAPAPRTTLAVLVAVVAACIVAAGIRAGWVSALVMTGVFFLVLMVPATALVVVERRRARAAAVAARPVKHCDCCDQACLMAKVCAPGAEPTVVHEPVS